MAYYENEDNSQFYVAMFCVDNSCQRCGIRRKMLVFLNVKFGNVYHA